LAQFVEHHVSQVIQGFSQLYRIDQGTAGPVIAVQPVQIRTGNQECGDPPAVLPNPDFIQSAAHTQQKRALKQIRHFNGCFQKALTPLQKNYRRIR
jgi:hypothetical protein